MPSSTGERLKAGAASVAENASRIFISYRREDSIAYAGRLYDHLSAHFGAEQVFMDIGQIDAGDDFITVLDREIDACDVVIALIGPGWLKASNASGRRLDQADDFVCHELAAALKQGKRLIPVLVGGATMPDARELPAAIAPLARRQAHALDDKRFQFDLDALIRSIERRPSLLNQFVQLMNAERLRRWRHYSAAGIAVSMLCFAWVQLFDLLGIDTRIESYTMALGDMVASVPVSERIVIVSFDEKSEARLGKFGPDWRREHARVIDRLVDAGAQVIVFDVYFEKANPADGELLAAIARARQRGSQVIVGVNQLLDQEPAAIPGLARAVSAWGLLCVGGRLGYASIAPLAVVKFAAAANSGPTPVERISARIGALGALAVGGTTLAVDEQLRELTLVSAAGRTIWRGPLKPVRTSVEDSGQARNECPLLASGDRVAEALIRLAPIDTWRQPPRRYDYEQISAPAATLAPGELAGKIVLIGDGRAGRDHFQVRRGAGGEFRHGVELHADIVNNLLQGVHVRGLDPLLQVLAMAALAVAGGWLRLFRPAMRALWRRLLLVGCLLAYLALTVLIYVQFGVLFNTAYHIGAFLLSYWLLGRLSTTAASARPA
ncbi:CHASE2 domain-containing protein [Accumulibacter sp.]|uniref:CHASE2 domain-containing protein n=1 Tax=Accumulibacter sp. TaxID=2053492 RepID=UPI001AD07A4A|nr:CHASE2 domain-containing protein [Accumulibacter sp.]MBN8514204.1 CHASE2 domain-containing protein [Accumulibacter sp.]MBO3703401.1 CHASE2 domain-containing protein [Accumulibacter sp.]